MRARTVKGLDPDGTLAHNARRIVEVRLAEVRSFAPRALDPEKPGALHDMRIAAKRLRYVLELSEPAFGKAAADGAKVARALQDLLGEIHDCDVMLPRVRSHVKSLREEDAAALRGGAGPGALDLPPAAATTAPSRGRYQGLGVLSAYLGARRDVLFARFVREWGELEERNFGAELLGGLSPPPEPAARWDGAGP